MTECATFIWNFLKTYSSWAVPLIVVGIIVAIIYLLLPTLARAGAIQMIARNRHGQEANVGTGLRYGIMSFLQLFEYHLLIKTFAFFSILIEIAFVLRNLGPVIFKVLSPLFIILLCISLLLTLLFTFADFFIVIDDLPIFESMKKSAKLVIMNWKHTFLITVLMMIIGIRIVIQAVFVFLIPTIIIVVGGYLASVAMPVTGIIIGGIIGLAALISAAYLNGIVDIFSYTVWTFAFLQLSEEKELSARETVGEKAAAASVAAGETPAVTVEPPKMHGHKNLQ